jgi:hypothetical protein
MRSFIWVAVVRRKRRLGTASELVDLGISVGQELGV